VNVGEVAQGDRSLSPEQVRRLWEYRSSVDVSFHQRNSFLLVAESMLLAGYMTVLPLMHERPWVPRVLAAFGALLTCAWWYVNARHYANYRELRAAVEERCPEYKAVRRSRRRWGPSTWVVVGHYVPALLLAVWVFLFVYAFVDSAPG
jgi:hypothetical protein